MNEQDILEPALATADAPARAGEPRARRRPRRHSWPVVAFVVLAYGVVAFLANRTVWVHGVAHTVQTSGGQDVAMEIWFLAQTPWVVLHGHNPLANDFLNAPVGLDVLDSTSVTLLGVLGAPITLAFGAIATYNVMLDVALAGSALAFYFMARRFVPWWPAAFVGGLVYGFSPFAYSEGLSHLVWTFNVIPPLVVLLLDRFFRDGRDSPWFTGVATGVCFVAEFYISAEAFASLAILTAIAALVFVVWAWRTRVDVDVPRVVRVCLCAGLVTVLGISVGAWVALRGPEHINGPAQTSTALAGLATDPVSLVVPTSNQHFTFGEAGVGDALVSERDTDWHIVFEAPDENGTYIGIPLLVTLVAGAVVLRRRRLVQFTVVMGLAVLVLSLGASLHVDGHRTGVPLPFWVIAHLPVLDSITAVRLMGYLWLFAALLLAVVLDAVYAALARRGGRSVLARRGGRSVPARRGRRSGRAGAAAASLVLGGAVLLPLLPAWPYSAGAADVPEWFTDGARSIPVGTDVVVYPFSGPTNASSMIWQAMADVRFRMPGGYAIFAGPDGTATFQSQVTPLQTALALCPASPGSTLAPAQVRDQLRAWATKVVVVDPGSAGSACATALFEGALGPPRDTEGVLLWNVPR